MIQEPNFTKRSIHPASLAKRVLQGAAIAFALIACFLLTVRTPDPGWGKLWMIRPLAIVTLAGAAGGVFYYFMDKLRYQGSWKKALAILLSLVVYIVGLWMGTILGLNGTLWD